MAAVCQVAVVADVAVRTCPVDGAEAELTLTEPVAVLSALVVADVVVGVCHVATVLLVAVRTCPVDGAVAAATDTAPVAVVSLSTPPDAVTVVPTDNVVAVSLINSEEFIPHPNTLAAGRYIPLVGTVLEEGMKLLAVAVPVTERPVDDVVVITLLPTNISTEAASTDPIFQFPEL